MLTTIQTYERLVQKYLFRKPGNADAVAGVFADYGDEEIAAAMISDWEMDRFPDFDGDLLLAALHDVRRAFSISSGRHGFSA